MSSSVRNLKIRCKVDDRPDGRNEGIDYYEGLSICMSKDPRAFEIQMRYQTTVRRELTQMLGQLERIRRNPLPPSPEPVPPHLEPGDVIEIPTAASSRPAAASSPIQAAANPSPEPGDCGSRCSQAADSSAVNEQIGSVSQSPDRPAEPASIHTPKQASGLQRHEQMRAVHPLRPAALPDVLSDEIG